MLVIRFLRTGKRNQPSFSIVVTEKERGPKAGRFIEKLGFYNPLTKERKFNSERIKYWLSVGAKPSATVHNLLITEKIIEGKKLAVHKKSKKDVQAPEQKPVEPQKTEQPTVQDEKPTQQESGAEPVVQTESKEAKEPEGVKESGGGPAPK